MSADFFELSLRMRQEGTNVNRKYVQLVADSPTLGLEPETPFFFASAPTLVARHLGILLRTADGRPLSFERGGSTDPGPAGMAGGPCDIYDAYTEDGELYESLVVNDYCTETTNKPPVGFSFSADPKDMPWVRKSTPSDGINRVEKPEQTSPEIKQLKTMNSASSMSVPQKQPQTYCRECGSAVDAKTKKCSGCGKQYFNAKKIIPFLLLVILLSLSICLNVVQYMSDKANTAEIRRLEEAVVTTETQLEEQISDIAEYQNTIADQKSKIDNQKIQIRDFKRKGAWFDEISNGVTSGNLGYASSSFFSSESVIVVKKDETNRTFTVTMNWSGKRNVSVDSYGYSTSAALVHFENEWWMLHEFTTWNRTVTVTIEPQHAGVQVFTFRNDRNSDAFNVIVIVTE